MLTTSVVKSTVSTGLTSEASAFRARLLRGELIGRIRVPRDFFISHFNVTFEADDIFDRHGVSAAEVEVGGFNSSSNRLNGLKVLGRDRRNGERSCERR